MGAPEIHDFSKGILQQQQGRNGAGESGPRRPTISEEQAAKRAVERMGLQARHPHRLQVAAQLAAGLLANPQTYTERGWETAVPSRALAMADRLIAMSGGAQ